MIGTFRFDEWREVAPTGTRRHNLVVNAAQGDVLVPDDREERLNVGGFVTTRIEGAQVALAVRLAVDEAGRVIDIEVDDGRCVLRLAGPTVTCLTVECNDCGGYATSDADSGARLLKCSCD